MKNQKGQMTIEAVLIMTVMVSVLLFIRKGVERTNLLSHLVENPWSHIQGMIENAYWAPTEKSITKHPNLLGRHGSPRGEEPQ